MQHRRPKNAAPSALCLIDSAGVQSRPQLKPVLMDFVLQPYRYRPVLMVSTAGSCIGNVM